MASCSTPKHSPNTSTWQRRIECKMPADELRPTNSLPCTRNRREIAAQEPATPTTQRITPCRTLLLNSIAEVIVESILDQGWKCRYQAFQILHGIDLLLLHSVPPLHFKILDAISIMRLRTNGASVAWRTVAIKQPRLHC
jgi:hypothetical protein